MRKVRLAVAMVVALGSSVGCSASGDGAPAGGGHGGQGGAGADASAGGGGAGQDGSLLDTAGEQPLDPDSGCATSVSQAQQAPAAFMIVLDRSSSMGQASKFAFAAQAIVQAIDNDAFDSMSIGAMAVPSGSVAGPACIFNLPVSCGVPPFPQVDLTLAGVAKSGDPTGVRHDIKAGLAAIGVDNGAGDATPVYAALQVGISSLKSWPKSGKRILLLVTDGTIDCTDGSGRAGYPDGNGCNDWEDPDNIVAMLGQANTDATQPIESFVVGVPGADTYDPSGTNFPPYHMRLALSAMAYAGSPLNVDPACTGTTYTQAGGDPTVSCHFDMTQGNFDAQALADAITKIRGKTLGCTYELPTPEAGTIAKDKVNVEYSTGGPPIDLAQRSSASDTCATDGCWDYDANGKIELIGKACDDVKTASNANVQIVVGCQTVIK